MLKKAIIISLIALIAVAGYFFWYKPKFGQMGAAGQMPMVSEVSAMKVQKQKVQLFLDLPGRVSAYKISTVRPQVEGVIRQQKFTEGSIVKEGQQLYQIDPAIYQAAFDDANESFKTLRAKKDRYKNLLEEDAVSKQEFDDVMAAFAQAEANMKKARTNLGYTRVLAPISGYIGKSNFTEGALVTANQADVLTTITQLSPIYVDMAQPSKDMIKLGDQKDIPVSLVIDEIAYNGMGTLKFSEVFADETTDSVRLRAIFTNENKKLIPGMFVNAKLHLKPIEAITVPQKITSRAPDGSLTIWVVEGDVAKARVIKAEQTSGDSWIVSEGLQEGDVIVYDGFQRLAEGMKVKPVFAAEKVVEENMEQVASVSKTSENTVEESVMEAKEVAMEKAPESIAKEPVIKETKEKSKVKKKSKHKKKKSESKKKKKSKAKKKK